MDYFDRNKYEQFQLFNLSITKDNPLKFERKNSQKLVSPPMAIRPKNRIGKNTCVGYDCQRFGSYIFCSLYLFLEFFFDKLLTCIIIVHQPIKLKITSRKRQQAENGKWKTNRILAENCTKLFGQRFSCDWFILCSSLSFLSHTGQNPNDIGRSEEMQKKIEATQIIMQTKIRNDFLHQKYGMVPEITWTMIAIWSAPFFIVRRHFWHFVFSGAYKILYGNASFISLLHNTNKKNQQNGNKFQFNY